MEYRIVNAINLDPDSHRNRALAKLRSELEKDIARAVDVAKLCGIWELLRLCYLLRLTRISMVVPDIRQNLAHADVAGLQMRDEALKYAIALVAKHGAWKADPSAINSIKGFENSRVEQLERFARHINAKFELEALLHIAEPRLQGERDQDCILDLSAGLKDPQRAMQFYYGLRLEKTTQRKKDSHLSTQDLVRQLCCQYLEVIDLFKSEAGISIENYCAGLLEIDAAFKARGEGLESAMGFYPDGRINPVDRRTFVAMARTMFFTDDELEESVNPEFIEYMHHHPFDNAAASDSELRFHYLSRRPFLMGNGFSVLSPDLVFDSVINNTHYTLLESDDSKEKYKKMSAGRFIDLIAIAAERGGYEEIDRDVFLKKGKQELGDIDLILHNERSGHTLLIEGKNHALPLGVYFRTPESVEQHLRQTRDWETKVQRRIDHLKGEAPSYQLTGPWDYVIVTQMPEPLSHLSHLLVLSLDEFEHWITQDPRPDRFQSFYDEFYNPERSSMSASEVDFLREEGFFLASPTND